MKRTIGKNVLFLFGVYVVLLLVVGSDQAFAQEVDYFIKLFDATPTTRSVRDTIPSQARVFASLPPGQIVFNFDPMTQRAVIAGDADGRSPFVVDNYLTIDGKNICDAGINGRIYCPLTPVGGLPQSQVYPGTCFCNAQLLTGVNIETVLGRDIDRVLAPLGPLDVSQSLRSGENRPAFTLEDYGVIYGNTEIFLVVLRKPVIEGTVMRLMQCESAAETMHQEDLEQCRTKVINCGDAHPDYVCMDVRMTCEKAAEDAYGKKIADCPANANP